MTTPTIDAHQHFWERGRFKDGWLDRPEHKPIAGSFLPGDLAPLLKKSGVQKSVFVQTQHDVEENRWVLGLGKEHDWISGVALCHAGSGAFDNSRAEKGAAFITPVPLDVASGISPSSIVFWSV